MISILLYCLFIVPKICFSSDQQLIDYYINNTNDQFNKLNSYKVQMIVKLDVPAFRMPKKKYEVLYKKPNKLKIKSKGFGVLPKTGLFTSPQDNFDNLKNIKISNIIESLNPNQIALKGDLIVDSLKLEMPNEYSRLTFDPSVEVVIDTLHWVITSVTTKLDTLTLFKINNSHQIYDENYFLPYKSNVKYFVKDKKLFNWINKDANSIIGSNQPQNSNSSMIEGNIYVEYKNYIINKDINDKEFEN